MNDLGAFEGEVIGSSCRRAVHAEEVHVVWPLGTETVVWPGATSSFLVALFRGVSFVKLLYFGDLTDEDQGAPRKRRVHGLVLGALSCVRATDI